MNFKNYKTKSHYLKVGFACVFLQLMGCATLNVEKVTVDRKFHDSESSAVKETPQELIASAQSMVLPSPETSTANNLEDTQSKLSKYPGLLYALPKHSFDVVIEYAKIEFFRSKFLNENNISDSVFKAALKYQWP